MAYSYADAKEQIKFYKRTRGPYWNNIVTSILRQVADESGVTTANKLIKECGLKREGWLPESEEKE